MAPKEASASIEVMAAINLSGRPGILVAARLVSGEIPSDHEITLVSRDRHDRWQVRESPMFGTGSWSYADQRRKGKLLLYFLPLGHGTRRQIDEGEVFDSSVDTQAAADAAAT